MSSSPTSHSNGPTPVDNAILDLAVYRRRRLGEMAVEREWISPEQLDPCLEEQKKTAALLGSILLRSWPDI